MKCPSYHHPFLQPGSQYPFASREILTPNLRNSFVAKVCITPVGSFTERGNQKRQQTERNSAVLCPGGMDLNAAYQICPGPKSKCKTQFSRSKSVRCGRSRRRRFCFIGLTWLNHYHYSPRRSSCWDEYTTRRITECCEYFCENVVNPNNGTAETFARL